MVTALKSHRVEAAIELAVIIPTYNEKQNISRLVAALQRVLIGTCWEIIFVDDNSPDGTADYIRKIAAIDRRVRVLERIGRRGLSSACIEGMLATPARYLAIMDGDLQHDEGALPVMLERIRSESFDVVVASRNAEGGSMGNIHRARVLLSDLGRRFSRAACKCDVSDPMSGFFLLDRAYFRLVVGNLSGTGFKILVDLLTASPRPIRVAEVPYTFRQRQYGESKLDANAELEYLYLLFDKLVGKAIPTRFALFVCVGAVGLLLHIAVLGLLYVLVRADFVFSQAIATGMAMTLNFLLNNVVTFRDRRLRGWRMATGLITFYVACSAGVLINISFARLLLTSHIPWYLAGLSGMAISSVWNYGVNTILTWRYSRSNRWY